MSLSTWSLRAIDMLAGTNLETDKRYRSDIVAPYCVIYTQIIIVLLRRIIW